MQISSKSNFDEQEYRKKLRELEQVLSEKSSELNNKMDAISQANEAVAELQIKLEAERRAKDEAKKVSLMSTSSLLANKYYTLIILPNRGYNVGSREHCKAS